MLLLHCVDWWPATTRENKNSTTPTIIAASISTWTIKLKHQMELHARLSLGGVELSKMLLPLLLLLFVRFILFRSSVYIHACMVAVMWCSTNWNAIVTVPIGMWTPKEWRSEMQHIYSKIASLHFFRSLLFISMDLSSSRPTIIIIGLLLNFRYFDKLFSISV